MSCTVAGAYMGEGGSNALLKRASTMKVEVALLDADKVCGADHLSSAVLHARRAFERGENASNTLSMEVILYASGERQISKAKNKMGLRQGTERVAVVLLSLGDLDQVLSDLGLRRDDSLLDCTLEKGAAYGIDPAELRTLGETLLPELVLEKVAFVDLIKR
ncbi:MAG: KEOPS complex subunit Cgi121 [Methanomassiliicoccales archaeon]|nr:KEOPS complex subunit Cgi121 [Methanomassiliicoccales archaeon]